MRQKRKRKAEEKAHVLSYLCRVGNVRKLKVIILRRPSLVYSQKVLYRLFYLHTSLWILIKHPDIVKWAEHPIFPGLACEPYQRVKKEPHLVRGCTPHNHETSVSVSAQQPAAASGCPGSQSPLNACPFFFYLKLLRLQIKLPIVWFTMGNMHQVGLNMNEREHKRHQGYILQLFSSHLCDTKSIYRTSAGADLSAHSAKRGNAFWKGHHSHCVSHTGAI